ncbi:MAG: hypothetical protein IMF05_04890, partial [Proteobacteria bacterium]|nr:hypothetical protein [Pseudomonadota bacterium]
MFSIAGKLFSRRQRRRLIGWKDAAILLLGGMVAVFATLGYFAFTLPLPDGFTAEPDRPSMLIKADDGEVFASRGVY